MKNIEKKQVQVKEKNEVVEETKNLKSRPEKENTGNEKKEKENVDDSNEQKSGNEERGENVETEEGKKSDPLEEKKESKNVEKDEVETKKLQPKQENEDVNPPRLKKRGIRNRGKGKPKRHQSSFPRRLSKVSLLLSLPNRI